MWNIEKRKEMRVYEGNALKKYIKIYKHTNEQQKRWLVGCSSAICSTFRDESKVIALNNILFTRKRLVQTTYVLSYIST